MPGTPAPALCARVPVEDVRPLRLEVLRPGLGPDSVAWPGDDDPRAGHYVVRGERGEVLGVGSIVPEAPGWRVRGMATVPAARGRGVGAAILAALVEHARAHGAGIVWCNARPRAMPLYERAGFTAVGEPFDVPGIGPHRRMELMTDPTTLAPGWPRDQSSEP